MKRRSFLKALGIISAAVVSGVGFVAEKAKSIIGRGSKLYFSRTGETMVVKEVIDNTVIVERLCAINDGDCLELIE